MRTLFVYYKVPAAEHAQWLPRVQVLCAHAQARWPGLSVEVLQRPDVNAEGRETWMEVWRQPDGVDPALAAALDELAQSLGLGFKRASEMFIPIQG